MKEKIKEIWNQIVDYVKKNWKHWLTLGLTWVISLINENKKLRKEIDEQRRNSSND